MLQGEALATNVATKQLSLEGATQNLEEVTERHGRRLLDLERRQAESVSARQVLEGDFTRQGHRLLDMERRQAETSTAVVKVQAAIAAMEQRIQTTSSNSTSLVPQIVVDVWGVESSAKLISTR